MIDPYDILEQIVNLSADCLNDNTNPTPCEYKAFVGIGTPPSDCSLVSANWISDRVIRRDDRCHVLLESTLQVNLVRCCLKNVGEDFDAALENDDAICFYDDYNALLECLLCDVGAIVKQHGFDCGNPNVDGAVTSEFAQGGCFSARFTIRFQRIRKCC